MPKKKCASCRTTRTLKWRCDPEGSTFCNICYLKERKGKRANNNAAENEPYHKRRRHEGETNDIGDEEREERQTGNEEICRDDGMDEMANEETGQEEDDMVNEQIGQQIIDNYKHQIQTLQEHLDAEKKKIELMQDELDAEKKKTEVMQEQLVAKEKEIEMLRTRFDEARTRSDEARTRLDEAQDKIKKQHNIIMELKGNIRVFCRVRPAVPDGGPGVISYPQSMERIHRGIDIDIAQKEYTFDKVFHHGASQEEVYAEISQLVQSALDGYKVCIFAYGQTGSGKTHTMMGDGDSKGTIPRAIEQILESCKTREPEGWKYEIKAEMLELYNDELVDLTAPRTRKSVGKKLEIKVDKHGKQYVEYSKKTIVRSQEQILIVLDHAVQRRSVGSTQMNKHSSRSHFILTLYVCGINERTKQEVEGALNLIDLAGSERMTSGAAADETTAINLSLFHLKNVLSDLSVQEKHVSYRSSKLTLLLKPYLGGDCKTLMFLNISPEQSSVKETVRTLDFGNDVNCCDIGKLRPQARRPQARAPTQTGSRILQPQSSTQARAPTQTGSRILKAQSSIQTRTRTPSVFHKQAKTKK